MHRYFFHLSSNRQCLDDIGAELEDLQAAKCLAVQYMVEHLCHQPHIFWENETCEVRVTDSDDLTLLVVSMVATLPATMAPAPTSADRPRLQS